MSTVREITKRNNIYVTLVENKWLKEKVVHQLIKYIGKEMKRRYILVFGPFRLLERPSIEKDCEANFISLKELIFMQK